jgi:methionine synthase I (cobalamin-dependent)
MRLDGGLATTLQKQGLRPFTSVDDWVLTRPDDVEAVHRAFTRAGAEVVLTGTFMAVPHRRGDWANVVDRAVSLASRAVAGTGAQMWGSLGSAGLPGEYAVVASRMADRVSGVALETFVDAGAAVAAVREVRRAFPGLPIAATLVPRADGRLWDGSEPSPALDALRAAGATFVGFNCAPPSAVAAAVARAPCDWVKPNRGELGRDAWAAVVRAIPAAHVGGCCGVEPEDLASLWGDALHR